MILFPAICRPEAGEPAGFRRCLHGAPSGAALAKDSRQSSGDLVQSSTRLPQWRNAALNTSQYLECFHSLHSATNRDRIPILIQAHARPAKISVRDAHHRSGTASKKDLAPVVLMTAVAYWVFRGLDPLEMLSGNVHPWDSWHYLGLSNQMIRNGIFNLSESRPFSYRLIQPALATLLRLTSNYSYAEASHTINTICAFATSVFCFSLWRSLGLSRMLSYAGILLITLSWLGPLRYSIYYPRGQFAFEILMTCISSWSLKNI